MYPKVSMGEGAIIDGREYRVRDSGLQSKNLEKLRVFLETVTPNQIPSTSG